MTELYTMMRYLQADKLKEIGISQIVFDRNGYQYHGVIAAFGDALRANEIKF